MEQEIKIEESASGCKTLPDNLKIDGKYYYKANATNIYTYLYNSYCCYLYRFNTEEYFLFVTSEFPIQITKEEATIIRNNSIAERDAITKKYFDTLNFNS